MIYFADTFYFLARANASDAKHARATAVPAKATDELVTTEWVLMEVADGLCHSRNRQFFIQLYDRLVAFPNSRNVQASHDGFDKALELYRTRRTKIGRLRTAARSSS